MPIVMCRNEGGNMSTNRDPDEEWAAIDTLLGRALTEKHGWTKAVQRYQPGCELSYVLEGRARVAFFLLPDEQGKVQRRWIASVAGDTLVNTRAYKGQWWLGMARDAYVALRELGPDLPMDPLDLPVRSSGRKSIKRSRESWLRHNMKAPKCLCGQLLEPVERLGYGNMERVTCRACGARVVLIDQTEPRWSLRVACAVDGCFNPIVSTDGRCAAHQEES